jgi:hypothetical protein
MVENGNYLKSPTSSSTNSIKRLRGTQGIASHIECRECLRNGVWDTRRSRFMVLYTSGITADQHG